MKKQYLLKEIAGVALVVTLLLAIGSLATVSAQGGYRNQDPRWDSYPNWGGSFELRQTALNAGYNEGSKEGRNDRARVRQANYQNFSAYQKATKGYNSRFGDRELYRRYFRLAFEDGYNHEYGIQVRRDGDYRDQNRGDRINNPVYDRRGRNWDRYGTYGGSFELRQTALNAGYNEGLKEGRNDRQKGRYRDFRSFSSYQKATTDYSSKLGDRELYRRYYRDGFENGYSDGLNGA